MELVVFVIDTLVIVGGMSIDHMGLDICIDVPLVVDDNDLDLEIGIPVNTLGLDITDWNSIFDLFHDHYVLDPYYYCPIFYPA